ncbi:MAG: xanthine dehydrogenase family protein molybdopterin-binding subunit [Actinomycetia bacterium]|nr:xanthine dehydrogenase family protein molybdopterin-binding subunit [Actinomycetes bacterium]
MGQSVRRVEDDRLLTGRSTFIANLDLGDAAVVNFVTSIHAHAIITSIDTSEAAAQPGVVDVVTGADLDLGPLLGLPEGIDRPILATERVRFVGEPVVAIVATSAAAASDAAELVEVSYRPLPAVVNPASAASSESLLFPDLGSNELLQAGGPGESQPIDFTAYEVVVDGEFINQRLAPCPLETRVAASMWANDGRLIHYAACQGAHPIQKGIAAYYGLEESAVRVITQDVGGSFGAKARLYPEDLLLPELARRTGRTVRWVPTRSDDMSGLGHSRAQIQRVRIGGDRDGTVRAISVKLVADLGAYPVTAGALARNTGMILPGPYKIDEVYWELSAVMTNTTPLAAYRGAGRPEAGALLDRAIDLFAAEVNMDPLTVRRLNLRRGNEIPWTNPTGLTYDSGDYHQALEAVVAEVGYDEVKAEQVARRHDDSQPLIGIGLSVFIDRTAGIPSPEYGALELRPDGSLRVLTGSSPYGQGHHTTWAMLVSERTGVPIDQIEVVHGDTDIVPRGGITGGSRSAQRAGSAIVEATDEFVEQAKVKAADLLEAAVGDVVLDVAGARFHVAGSPGATSVGWIEIAVELTAEKARAETEDYVLKCESDFLGDGPSVPYGAYAAVVDVDRDTGEVPLRRLVTVDDAGAVINPMIVFGQVHGALAQGVGQAMYEEFAYDDNGNPRTSTFLDYGFPSAAEMPSFECFLTQTPSPNNPLGAKGIAESGTIGAVPAIQNAVIDALAHEGVRHIDLPITPERVWAAMTNEN